MAKEAFTVFEVGPRDGLQNEPVAVPLEDKIAFLNGLLAAGVRNIELGAFVRPDRVPQMADTDEIYRRIESGEIRLGKARAWSLVPNRKGLERALQAGARNIALFTAATDSFARQNIGMSVKASLAEFSGIVADIRSSGKSIHVRGYVSTAFGCPFEGKVNPRKPLKVIEGMLEAGVNEISIGDTIGVATPNQVDLVIKPALRMVGKRSAQKLAGHFHDTRGTALANSLRAIELGVRTLDSSAGGLGGCPFAPGASGNLATEDLVYLLEGMGFRTGIHLHKLCETSAALLSKVFARTNRPIASRYLQSYLASASRTHSCASC
ncbi:MAG: hypothetical protein A2X94_16720 [Bdellovibrionales bacterium GWB1_55_8]|nr:MAG: hypothetical protein A2X94_16720 [Bdellovibrionales bacterium GWB1_55_8]